MAEASSPRVYFLVNFGNPNSVFFKTMNPHYGCSLKNPALHVQLPVLSTRYWVPLQGQSLTVEVISFVVMGKRYTEGSTSTWK